MNITVNEAIAQATAQKREKITLEQIGIAIGTSKQYISKIRNKILSPEQIEKIEKTLDIKLSNTNQNDSSTRSLSSSRFVNISYFPELYMFTNIHSDVHEKIILDSSLLISENGNQINPDYCKIVRISGNSMYPEYKHGDRVIIDQHDTLFTDGQIYAFRYEGQYYIKEINRLGNDIKCISINRDYGQFFIKSHSDLKIFGRIIPRIRL